ncbi:MAG: hypothetical protein KAJ19_18845 [Gammaproteobacteria bacterium]|nr:hypothetical protein [Gammaproteobacteria bacterium]
MDNITQITTRSHTSLSDVGSLTHANLEAALAIGSSNKVWQPATINGNQVADAAGGFPAQYNTLNAGNTGGVEKNVYLFLDKPPALPSGENLVVTRFRVEVLDADASNEISNCYWYKIDDNGVVNISADGTDRSTVATFTYDIADQTFGTTGHFGFRFKYRTVTTAALEFYAEVEYYYA